MLKLIIATAVAAIFSGNVFGNDLTIPDTGIIPSTQDSSLKLPAVDSNGVENYDVNAAVFSPEYNAETNDLWERIRKGFLIPDLDNSLVKVQTDWYASRPDYITRTTNRASLYVYHVVQELEKRNMPTELALLPFIESAFNPQAVSSAKAAGMWQFVPATGKDFNLKQNMFKDDRRSVIKSTDAALTYLQKLHDMFGDWQLALAAYNWGEGSVQRAIKKANAAGRPTDFNSLSEYMPVETKNYVPKLQAVKNIISHPETYGLTLAKVENQPYFTAVSRTRDIDVHVAAKLAELPLPEFKALNPQFNKPVITGSANTQILLPAGNAEKFKTNLLKWKSALSTWTSHTVVIAKEKIETIAKRFNTTPEVIREVNNIPLKMAVKEGSTLLVPRDASASTQENDITQDVADSAHILLVADAPETRRIHIKVGKHDSLAVIASRYNMSENQIMTINHLDTEHLKKGQKLIVEIPYKGHNAHATARGRIHKIVYANTLTNQKKYKHPKVVALLEKKKEKHHRV